MCTSAKTENISLITKQRYSLASHLIVLQSCLSTSSCSYNITRTTESARTGIKKYQNLGLSLEISYLHVPDDLAPQLCVLILPKPKTQRRPTSVVIGEWASNWNKRLRLVFRLEWHPHLPSSIVRRGCHCL